MRRIAASVVLLALTLLLASCKDSPAPPSGVLQVNVVGLASGVNAQVFVTGPADFATVVGATTALTALVDGEYSVRARTVTTDSTTYAPSDSVQTILVSARSTASASIPYALTTGRLRVALGGLPPSATGKISVTGPGNYTATLIAAGTLNHLKPGTYEISSGIVTVGTSVFAPEFARIAASVGSSISPSIATLTFKPVSVALVVSVNGLPESADARVRVTGPNGFDQIVGASETLPNLYPGTYTIAADTVKAGSDSWAAQPATQKVTLTTAGNVTVFVNYQGIGETATGQNIFVAGAHLQQVVQSFGGAVPMLAGRDALLRVFVLASSAGMTAPKVRVRLFDGQTEVSAVTIDAPATTVPVTVSEGDLGSSWNYTIPAALVKPGLGISAEVDPDGEIIESVETDNSWPSSGAAYPIEVRVVPPLQIRFVPIMQPPTGLMGRVTAQNVEGFLTTTRQLLPVVGVDAQIAPPFTSNAPPALHNDANGAWNQILSEINALRAAEGGTAHYFGILQTTYTSGIAGLGYINGRAAIGWDFLPRSSVMVAHELGHNFARFHAPCGGAGGVDALYPYDAGAVGVYGFDALSAALVPPTAADLMGYCPNVWISDYNFAAMLDYRVTHNSTSALTAPSRGAPEPGLLVWGRIGPEGIELEPAYEVTAPPLMPGRPGPERLEIVGTAGREIVSVGFDALQVADGIGANERHFAFVIPTTGLQLTDARSIRLRDRQGRTAVRTRAAAPRTAGRTSAVRDQGGAVRLNLDPAEARGALVRDAATGRIIGFARAGSAVMRTDADSLDVVVSDGIRSRRERISVGGAR